MVERRGLWAPFLLAMDVVRLQTFNVDVPRLTSHVSRLTSHVSRLTSHVSRIAYDVVAEGQNWTGGFQTTGFPISQKYRY
jgi:hypothetical protein